MGNGRHAAAAVDLLRNDAGVGKARGRSRRTRSGSAPPASRPRSARARTPPGSAGWRRSRASTRRRSALQSSRTAARMARCSSLLLKSIVMLSAPGRCRATARARASTPARCAAARSPSRRAGCSPACAPSRRPAPASTATRVRPRPRVSEYSVSPGRTGAGSFTSSNPSATPFSLTSATRHPDHDRHRQQRVHQAAVEAAALAVVAIEVDLVRVVRLQRELDVVRFRDRPPVTATVHGADGEVLQEAALPALF